MTLRCHHKSNTYLILQCLKIERARRVARSTNKCDPTFVEAFRSVSLISYRIDIIVNKNEEKIKSTPNCT